MVRIIIVRHAETNSNKRNICLGRKDEPLNQNGVRQAGLLVRRMKDVFVDVIYSSPMSRTYNTARVFLVHNGQYKRVSVTEAPALIERDWGDWEGKTLERIRREHPEQYADFKADMLNYAVPGGESSAAVQARVNGFLDEILPRHDGETVYLCTHLGTSRHCISRLLGLPPEESWKFRLDNASYAEIEYSIKDGYGVLKRFGV